MTIAVDYLIVGAGATGLAFADRILSNSDATMAIVDRRAQVGGHWVDSYDHVRLHAPTAYYGVDSLPFGDDRLDTDGWNEGLGHCARGTEIRALYENVLHGRLLPSGRVRFLPLHEYSDGTVRSLMTGEPAELEARRIVDTGYGTISVPKTHPPRFDVADNAPLVPPHELGARAAGHDHFVVIGAGKTGMDAVTFLLSLGASKDQIEWVVPRDPYVINRAMVQTAPSLFERSLTAMVTQAEAMAEAASTQEFEDMMVASGNWLVIDPAVRPTMFHAACCSEKERDGLASVRIIRQGRVLSVDGGAVTVEGGALPLTPRSLVVNASTSAMNKDKPTVPIFANEIITPQMIRYPFPCLSAALIAEIERVVPDEEKNSYAQPTGVTDLPSDFLRTAFIAQKNQMMWNRHPQLKDFLRRSRLDAFGPVMRAGDRDNPHHQELFNRLKTAGFKAAGNIPKLLAAA